MISHKKIIHYLVSVSGVVALLLILLHSEDSCNASFFKRQYMAHASYGCKYPANSMPLYEYIADSLDYDILECDIVFTKDNVPVLNHGSEAVLYSDSTQFAIDISEKKVHELYKYSLSRDSIILLSTAEELIRLCKYKNKCIMFDMSFQDYTIDQYGILYDLVSQWGMTRNILWADANVYKLFLFDRNLICQFGSSWDIPHLLYAKFKSFFCGKVILSDSYIGKDAEKYRNFVNYGHRMGFIMKISTINNPDIADSFWNIGTDIIITDNLRNYDY